MPQGQDDITDLQTLQAFLDNLASEISKLRTVCNYWSDIADLIDDYVNGTSDHRMSSLMPAVNGLVNADAWQGSAADEFLNKAKVVRDYGMQLVTHITGSPGTAGASRTPGSAFIPALNQIIGALSDTKEGFDGLKEDFALWTGMLSAIGRAYNSYVDWNLAVPPSAPFKVPTFADLVANPDVIAEWRKGGVSANLTTDFMYQNPTFTINGLPSWGDGRISCSSSGLNSVTLTYSNPRLGIQQPFKAEDLHLTLDFWNMTADADKNTQSTVLKYFLKELYQAAAPLIPPLGQRYSSVVFPSAADDTGLPGGKNSSKSTTPGSSFPSPSSGTGNVPPYGVGAASPKAGTGNSGSYSGTTGSSAFHSPSTGTGSATGLDAGSGSYDPGIHASSGAKGGSGSYAPAGYDPGAYQGSGYTAGPAPGWDSSKLASYDPSSGSSAAYDPGAPGAGGPLPGAAGTDAGSVPGVSGAGAGVGAGAAGATGTGAGAAGRGMPMAPMGAAAGGRDGKERPRASFLPEDDDVWGAEGDGDAPAVL
jgi:hypothetical protein